MRQTSGAWYHRLMCGHIRRIRIKVIPIVLGETEVYCVPCDKFSVVVKKAERWDEGG